MLWKRIIGYLVIFSNGNFLSKNGAILNRYKIRDYWLRFTQSISTVFVRQNFSLDSRWICPKLFQWFSWLSAWSTHSSMQEKFTTRWESNTEQSTSKPFCKDNSQNFSCNADKMLTNYSFKTDNTKFSFNKL